MSRFLIFFSIVLSLLAGIHFYLWVRLVRDTQLPSPYRPVATFAFAILAVSIPVMFAFRHKTNTPWGRILVWPPYVWMGLMFFLLVLVTGTDIARLVARALAKVSGAGPMDAQRRTLVAQLAGALATVGATSLAAFALNRGLQSPAVNDIRVRLRRLPKASDGFTILHLTDVHIGPTIGREFIEDLVLRCNALAPDVIAITGDLVDGSVAELGHATAPLSGLRARHGVFFVTGNHEYFSGAQPWVAALEKMGIRVLRNQRVAIGDGPEGFDLAGIDDHSGAGFEAGHGPNLPAALAGRDASRELILLAHQPRAIHEAARNGVGLQLSGHTHGGQIWPFRYLVRLQQPYVEGLHRHGDTQIYVSPGTGYWGPPMRLGTQGEIARITLVADSTASDNPDAA